MRHSVMTEQPAPMMSADQFALRHHHSQQPATTAAAAAAAASLTSGLIHASLVAASSSQSNGRTLGTCSSISSNSTAGCELNVNNSNNATQQPAKKPRMPHCVAAPTMSYTTLATLEYSVHVSPKRMIKELTTVFPNRDLSNLLVVPTIQKCNNDMVAWDDEIAKEKDDRLEDFVRWATALHDRLERLGFWSDMTDPASGFPSFSERGRDVYPDVEGCQLLLKYDFQNAGCCKVLLHPTWGSKIYPATFFTTAPTDVLLRAMEDVEQEFSLQA
ncbi:hypothetical protein BGZ70_010279 [Mortierella alpina]|uniref:Methylmalonic aciduria and homocystinuria type D protein n=1 Tax=Mortierella alpina TaxID=64518 RepID=A0A9P6LZW7_MORAP|nr:hypothetical protein BGZ70_010279 [Mortierella alpina]